MPEQAKQSPKPRRPRPTRTVHNTPLPRIVRADPTYEGIIATVGMRKRPREEPA